MKNYKKEITIGLVFATIVAGLFLWFIKHEPDAYLKISIAIIFVLLGVYTYIRQIVTRKSDLKDGVPSEDEFTNLAKLHASSQAFFYSMYLWLLIFIFHSSFSNTEEMLGIGIMGSALIYGISLWYFKSTGDFNEK
ncbi:MAG: hypothetical protein B6I38_10115 [Anaerolineaceae bacterium 4572_5.1]|nr:MAG: hypothetical protein B6I38_10115 [Anaerolineaceae bacterium 4572_5.1]